MYRPVTNNNVAVTAVDNALEIKHLNTNHNDPYVSPLLPPSSFSHPLYRAQVFSIHCQSCTKSEGGRVAGECQFKSHGRQGWCVIAPNWEGNHMHFAHCDSSQQGQLFEVFTQAQGADNAEGDEEESNEEW